MRAAGIRFTSPGEWPGSMMAMAILPVPVYSTAPPGRRLPEAVDPRRPT